jgi:hypothetical protein
MYLISNPLEIMNRKGVITLAIPVFDKSNILHHLRTGEVLSICKEGKTRRNIVRVSGNKFYLPHTIEQIDVLMSPLGFYQVNQNQIINLTQIDKYKNGIITIEGEEYFLSRRRIPLFESLYFPE